MLLYVRTYLGIYTGKSGWPLSLLDSTYLYEAIPPGQMAVPDLYRAMVTTRTTRFLMARRSNNRRLSAESEGGDGGVPSVSVQEEL